MRFSRKLIVLLVIMVVVIGGITGYIFLGRGGGEKAYETAVVQRGDIEVIVSAYGNIAMGERAQLNFGSPGTVKAVYVEVGDRVQYRNRLAQMDTIALEVYLDHAWASYYSAVLYLQIIQETPGTDHLELDAARWAVEAALDSVRQAEDQLAKATIRAPFDGLVVYVGAEAGDQVLGTMPIVIVVDPDTPEVITLIDELDILSIELGQEAVITIDALPDVEFSGEVTEVALTPTAQEWVIGYAVTIAVELADDYQLLEGLSASADIIVDRAEDVLLIPSRAVKTIGGQRIVQVVVEDGIEEREIQIGLSDSQWTEVTGGLSAGESVVVR